jgi:hypothetical protein
MMAAAINKDHPGSGWTADIASKKYLYLQGKYSAAKTASHRSDWGLSQTELTKGITMDKKLEGMCKDFCIWDKWFGATQKYNPSNVQDSSRDSPVHPTVGGAAAVYEAQGSNSDANDEEEDGNLFPLDGSASESEAFPGDSNLQTQPGAFHPSIDGHDSNERANAFTHGVVPLAPAQPLMSQLLSQEQPPPKPPTQAQVRKDKAKEKADELQKTKEKIMEAINSNASTSVNNSPRGTFDATYVATTNAKIEGSIRVESMRASNQKAIASDELKLSTMKLQFLIESAESDRVSRGSIQTEINITSLLNTDPSGTTARLMIALVAERGRVAASAAPVPDASLSNNVAAFQLSLAMPVVRAVTAAAVPEVIVLSESKSTH